MVRTPLLLPRGGLSSPVGWLHGTQVDAVRGSAGDCLRRGVSGLAFVIAVARAASIGGRQKRAGGTTFRRRRGPGGQCPESVARKRCSTDGSGRSRRCTATGRRAPPVVSATGPDSRAQPSARPPAAGGHAGRA